MSHILARAMVGCVKQRAVTTVASRAYGYIPPAPADPKHGAVNTQDLDHSDRIPDEPNYRMVSPHGTVTLREVDPSQLKPADGTFLHLT